MKLKKLYSTLIFCLCVLAADATHIVGGELYYQYIGNNQYRIQLIVYRDCYNGVPPFDDPALVGIWDANNTLLSYVNLYPLDSILIPNIINSPCNTPPVDVCYRKCTYAPATVTLPPRPGGYQLAYQRCCRNQTILNIIDPLDVGASFYATIPGSIPNNSNPVFTNLPPSFICAGMPFVFDHSATDSDGDSLVYELCVPYDGASVLDPVLYSNTVVNYSPPFTSVVYQPPFGPSNLLGGVPLTIDPQTGVLTATPNTIGQFVIGVCVNEYRNGVFLSKTRRDYQLNVKACPSIVVAALQTPLLTCGSNTVQFVNNSFGASAYSWNFGDPNTLADTSHNTNPSYTYPDTGTYQVSLIAYSIFNPQCLDSTVGTVTILPDYTVDFSYTQAPCSFTVQFSDTSNTDSGVTTQWSWNFGDNLPTSITADPIHTFPGPGTYPVTLNATSALGCRETVVHTVVIPPVVSVSPTSGQVTCNNLCTGQSTANVSNGIPPLTYQWNDPALQTSATATGLCPGTYMVTVTDGQGCTASGTANISNPLVLTAGINTTDAYCEGMCIGTATAIIAGGTPPYNIQWDDPASQTGITATGLCPGTYQAHITDVHGCSVNTPPADVVFSSYIPPLDATISQDTIYTGQMITLNANTTGGVIFEWMPSGGLSNPNAQSPTASPTENTTYYVTITDANGCTNTDSVKVVVKTVTCTEPEIFIPNAFTPNNDNNNDVLYVRGNTIRELEFKVFDRWGEKVFESNDPKSGWDGYFRGKLATPAVYVYYVDAVCYDNQRFFKKGNITLIR